MYHQNYNPTGSVLLSTLLAAVPILVLLYFIAVHPHRDERGIRRFGLAAPYAAFYGVLAAFLVSCLAFRMPLVSAVSAFVLGSLLGLLGIIWIVVAAMFLYTMTVITGKFEIVKESIVHISFDRRLQVLLIAFSFGAIIEGTSGFGTPVAIAGAVMVGLGYTPFQSAVLNLLANTAPVAWGAIGTPIVTLAAVSGLDQLQLSTMAGHQLPWVSILVPFWLVVTFVKMEGGTWRQAFEVWPGLAPEEPLPSEIGDGRGRRCEGRGDRHAVGVQVHGRANVSGLDSVDDSDSVLRAVGKPPVQEGAQRVDEGREV